MAAPLRSEIDNEFKWAVNDIYSSDKCVGRRLPEAY